MKKITAGHGPAWPVGVRSEAGQSPSRVSMATLKRGMALSSARLGNPSQAARRGGYDSVAQWAMGGWRVFPELNIQYLLHVALREIQECRSEV
jgi:hypothetical protein